MYGRILSNKRPKRSILHDISGRRLESHCKCLYSLPDKYLGVVKTTPRGAVGDGLKGIKKRKRCSTMIKINFILLLSLLFIACNTKDSDKEEVLNEIFKSQSFDNIYQNDTVFCLKNDLVISGHLDSLQYGQNVVFFTEDELYKDYVVIGSFIWDSENRDFASVQLEVFASSKIANYRLKNVEGKWIIIAEGILDL